MGSEVRGIPEAAPLNGGAAPPKEPSIGQYLARQRSLRGISIDELAGRTRIPRRSLERLEAGAFDLTPDGFTRGFVRTVAEALGLDPDETVMRMLHEPGGEMGAGSARAARLPVMVLAGLLLAALLAAAGWGLWWLGGALGSARGAPDADELVYRRDAVRALAAERHEADASAPPPQTTPETD